MKQIDSPMRTRATTRFHRIRQRPSHKNADGDPKKKFHRHFPPQLQNPSNFRPAERKMNSKKKKCVVLEQQQQQAGGIFNFF